MGNLGGSIWTTVEDLLAGKRIEHPEMSITNVKRAERKTKHQQKSLF